MSRVERKKQFSEAEKLAAEEQKAAIKARREAKKAEAKANKASAKKAKMSKKDSADTASEKGALNKQKNKFLSLFFNMETVVNRSSRVR